MKSNDFIPRVRGKETVSMKNQITDLQMTHVEEIVKKSLVSRPATTDKRTVTILSDASGLVQYAENTYVGYQQKNPLMEIKFSFEDFMNYLYTIIVSRVEWCKNHAPIVHPQSETPVPALLVMCLANIGVAENPTYGAVLVPEMAKETKVTIDGKDVLLKLLTIEEVRTIGTWIKVYDPTNYSLGYPKDKRGEWALMTYFLSQEGEYISQFAAENHLVYSVLAALLGVNLQNTDAFYVSAGNKEELKEVIWKLTQF